MNSQISKIPPHQSLIQYYQLRDRLIILLHELADLAEQRSLTIIIDDWVEGRIPRSQLSPNIDGLNQFSLKVIVQEDIRPLYEPFRIAVAGEFTRGKTTLLNVLLEREILTTDRRPNTATCTTLKYGEFDRIRVTYFDSTGLESVDTETQNLAADLARYTSDAAMDREKYEALLRRDEQSLAEQVEAVDVWLPAEFLRQRGYEIVDTPGLGSIFETHQVITYNAIPQMDAVLFLTQFNALIGEDETIFLGSLREYLNRFLFILTKVDLAEKEQNPQEAVVRAIDFTRSVLTTNIQLHDAPIYPISALAALQEDRYEESGIIQLAQALDQFIAHSCGRERLLKLYRSANTYRLWIEHDIQLELDNLNHQIAQLDDAENRLVSDLNAVESSGRDLRLLVRSQIELLVQNSLFELAQLPERIQISVAKALAVMDLEALQEVPVTLRPTLDRVVQAWLKEQEAKFIQGARLLQNDVQFFLKTKMDWQVQLDWKQTDASTTITLPDLPSLDSLMKELRFSLLLFVSAIGLLKFLRERVEKEFLKPQPPSNQTAYENITFDVTAPTSIRHQCEHLFRQWAQSLSEYLEATVYQGIIHYREGAGEQIRQIDQQRNTLKQRLNLIQQQFDRVQDIHNQLVQIQEILGEMG